MICFSIVGGGWRSEFFLRIARALPASFRVDGVVVRDEMKGRLFEERWGVTTYRDVNSLLEQCHPAFVVVSVPWDVSPVMITELATRGIPVLAETPPAPDLRGLIALHKLATETRAKIQVAEQYQFQPLHTARLSIVALGKIGTVSQTQLSVAHGYHGISLMRLLLGVGFADAQITAQCFLSPVIEGPDRAGPPQAETYSESRQVIALFQFNDRIGIYDFSDDQYFSWIRSPRFLVRGDRGEINGVQVRYLEDFQTPVELNLKRVNAGENGNLEGYYLKGILAGDQWVYKNPFIPGRLTDDEIAIATCLQKMNDYVNGGPSFYSLAEAAQDHYLSLSLKQAIESQKPVKTSQQPWAVSGQ